MKRRRRNMPAADVIRYYSSVDSESGCWLWAATRTPSGYGHVWFDGRMQAAHRLSYTTFVGAIPDDLVIDHLCRVRHCVNPAHMEPVTNLVNMRRGVSPVAQVARTNRCVNGHEFTPSNTSYTRSSWGRQCRECKRVRDRARAERRRQEVPVS